MKWVVKSTKIRTTKSSIKYVMAYNAIRLPSFYLLIYSPLVGGTMEHY
jgi:hypothetical protein